MNRAEEDYIKTIYELTIEKKETMIKTNELSERFGFTDQSVNEMIKKLESKDLVSFIPYKGVSLTLTGQEIAIGMVRSHRIWEVFLTEKLGISWESVHDDAEMLEHATSEDVLKRLYEYLGKPKYCQHGNPIPDFDGNLEVTEIFSLADVQIGQTFEITRVIDHKHLLIYLNDHDIKLYHQYVLIERDDFSGLMTIEKEGAKQILSIKMAKMLFGHLVN